jgi:hypothetical protein
MSYHIDYNSYLGQESSDSDSVNTSTTNTTNTSSSSNSNNEYIIHNWNNNAEQLIYGNINQINSRIEDDDSFFELMDRMEEMAEVDQNHLNQEKLDGHYYLGIISLIERQWLLESSLSSNVFYRYSYEDVKTYLFLNTNSYPYTKEVQIIKIDLQTFGKFDMYNVIIKTYWIRLIQRHWRKICKENQTRNERKKSPIIQRYREIHGKYPVELQRLRIYGMLFAYSNNKYLD